MSDIEPRISPTKGDALQRVAAARFETAMVRTMLDEVDRLIPPASEPLMPGHRLAEDIARLGRCLLDLASHLRAAHHVRYLRDERRQDERGEQEALEAKNDAPRTWVESDACESPMDGQLQYRST